MSMKRILIIHRGSLGDFLLLLPALNALRRQFPQAHIEILGRPEILSLVFPGPVNAIDSVERAELLPLFEQAIGLSKEVSKHLSSFDAALACVSDPERILQRNLSHLGIKNVIVRPPFPPAGERVTVSQYLLDVIRLLVHDVTEQQPAVKSPLPFLTFNEDELRWAESFLRPQSPPPPFAKGGIRDVIAIHPGSGSEKKCWPKERFEALARRLSDDSRRSKVQSPRSDGTVEGQVFGSAKCNVQSPTSNVKRPRSNEALERRVSEDANCSLLLILGPADERLVGRVAKLSRELDAVIAQNLPLRHLAAALSRCAVYVGNDSGVTHLAAATGIPTLAIFGPTDPEVWAPQGDNVKIIRGDADCSPCARDTMSQCANVRCLTSISAEGMTEAVRRLITR